MKKITIPSVIVWALTLVTIVSPSATAASDDALLNMLPDNTLFCVRINQFDTSLALMDQYLTGASPLPVSLVMLANMQLAGLTGDPMLTGVDKDGTFLVAGFASPMGVDMVFLAPVTDFDAFVQNNPACTPAQTPGVTLLAAPSSPTGTLSLMAAPGGQYAIVASEHKQEHLAEIHQRLGGEGAKLVSRLDTEQSAQAASSPLWGYVNLAAIYERYGQVMLGGIDAITLQMGDTPAAAELMEMNAAILRAMVQSFLGQADAMTLMLSPQPDRLTLDLDLRAKDGSDLAAMLTADPKAAATFSLAGYADSAAAVNGVFKTHRIVLENVFAIVSDAMSDVADENISAEEMNLVNAFMDSMLNAMGDETFVAYSYGAGRPPFQMQQVQQIADPAAYDGLMRSVPQLAERFYKAMGMPVAFDYRPAVERYKNVAIDRFKMKFATDVGDEFDMINQMYGPEGMVYYIARKDDLLFTTFGDAAIDTLKTLIDTPTEQAPAGELQKAFTVFGPAAHQADMVAAVNIVKLGKGMMGAAQQSGAPAEFFAPMAAAFDVSTQSCMAAMTTVADGKISARAALPKQHLAEIFTAMMKVQEVIVRQQMEMQQQMQKQTEQQSDASPPSVMTDETLQAWIGKPAPDMRLTDLQGNTYSIADQKGKKVIVDFWATWCPPCKAMIPDMIKLRNSHPAEQLTLLAVSDESANRLGGFAEDNKINYAVISHNRSMPGPYGEVTGLPTTFFIDSDGIIRYILVGYHSFDEMDALLKTMP